MKDVEMYGSISQPYHEVPDIDLVIEPTHIFIIVVQNLPKLFPGDISPVENLIVCTFAIKVLVNAKRAIQYRK